MAIKLIQIPHKSGNIKLRFATGHFATSHSHLNYYIDMTMTKHRLSEAQEAAAVLCSKFNSSTVIDTILCLDGTEVIGACMADQLTRAGYMNMNAHRTIYVATPEHVSGSQLIFRDNLVPMVTGKAVLLLISTVNSGKTIRRVLECVEYYGAAVQGIAAVFSTVDQMDAVPVYSLFTPEDIPGYTTSAPKECVLCKTGQKIDALANSYGFSHL